MTPFLTFVIVFSTMCGKHYNNEVGLLTCLFGLFQLGHISLCDGLADQEADLGQHQGELKFVVLE